MITNLPLVLFRMLHMSRTKFILDKSKLLMANLIQLKVSDSGRFSYWLSEFQRSDWPFVQSTDWRSLQNQWKCWWYVQSRNFIYTKGEQNFENSYFFRNRPCRDAFQACIPGMHLKKTDVIRPYVFFVYRVTIYDGLWRYNTVLTRLYHTQNMTC